MSSLSSIEDATKNFFTTASGSIDLSKVVEIVNAIVSAAPAIEQGIVSATPFVEAIAAMIKNGGQPSDAEWAALKASLDAGSATLAEAEAEAQAELGPIDPTAQTQADLGLEPVTEPTADGGADIVTTHTGINTGESVE